jgi:hypothetical protein
MTRFYHKHSSILVLTLVCLLGWTPEAHAYLDLGTGTMALQWLMASILGLFFTFKTYLWKFKGFLKSLIGKRNANDSRD